MELNTGKDMVNRVDQWRHELADNTKYLKMGFDIRDQSQTIFPEKMIQILLVLKVAYPLEQFRYKSI
ncbi:hypothetical protein A4A49_38987 [Nicotiana attenuata]|uniref:Uncharacterized protein n=1 Tax=Nicotiana attenuata TaxID=49451 RepID=A0A1J6JWC4_NICAT|nr:hypothetical protein A4A49_38987 [Nicotiana attenuata]